MILSFSSCSSSALPTAHHDPLSLHDALPISRWNPSSIVPVNVNPFSRVVNPLCCWMLTLTVPGKCAGLVTRRVLALTSRSEEHTSELQSPCNLVCRLLLEKKKRGL